MVKRNAIVYLEKKQFNRLFLVHFAPAFSVVCSCEMIAAAILVLAPIGAL